MVVLLPSLPMLSKLEIRNCKEVDCGYMNVFGSPNSVVLHEISNNITLREKFMQGLEKATTLSIMGDIFPSLLPISYMATSQIEIVKLICCESLLQCFLNLMSLRLLTIESFPGLVSFPDTGFPPRLRAIRVRLCMNLSSLPDTVHNSACLEDMEIYMCDSLVSFKRGQLPPTLKRLRIRYCENLHSLLDEEEDSSFSACSIPHLENLVISRCESLTSLSAASKLLLKLKDLKVDSCSSLESIAESFGNNTSLERINIRCCPNLKSLPDDLHKLINLRKINIVDCLSLVSFPCRGLPTTHLERLQVRDCLKIEPLPDNIHNFTSLRTLVIKSCRSNISFPDEGLPTNLTILNISFSNLCKPLFEWGLHRFASLRQLHIRGGCPDVVSFPDEEIGMVLPASLTDLLIRDFPNLEYLSTKGFESLASLQLLLLQRCPKLASFPKSLPPSVLELYVFDCPLLKKNYEKNKTQVRSKIDYIPCIKIENDSEDNGMDSDEEEMYDDREEEEKDTDCEEEETDSGSEFEDEGEE